MFNVDFIFFLPQIVHNSPLQLYSHVWANDKKEHTSYYDHGSFASCLQTQCTQLHERLDLYLVASFKFFYQFFSLSWIFR